MKFATMLYATDFAMRPDDFAVACEARGFESVWYPEHTHIPASRVTPFPGGGDLPKHYWHIHDPFVALTAAATATKTIGLGAGGRGNAPAFPGPRRRSGDPRLPRGFRRRDLAPARPACGADGRGRLARPQDTR